MKTILKYILIAIMVSVSTIACRDESLNPLPDMNDNIGAVTLIAVNPDRTFYNLSNPLADEFVEFTIDVDGFGITKINSVDLELIYTEKGRVYDPFQDIYVDSVYDAVLIKTVSTFPITVQITPAEIATALGISMDDLELGDNFNVVFPINTADGRRLTTALNSELCNQPAQPSFGGCNVQWSLTCPSAIPLGTYTAVSTATSTDACPPTNPLVDFTYEVELTSTAAGKYEVSDFFAGVYIDWYGACYGYDFETPASFTDVCNDLSFSFQDAFDATVQGTGTYDSNTGVITYSWVNDFGDEGTTTLTPQ
jgi:hypothetical protein